MLLKQATAILAVVQVADHIRPSVAAAADPQDLVSGGRTHDVSSTARSAALVDTTEFHRTMMAGNYSGDRRYPLIKDRLVRKAMKRGDRRSVELKTLQQPPEDGQIECTPESSPEADADVGVLSISSSCPNDEEEYTCIPSDSSTTGGICAPSRALQDPAEPASCPEGCPQEICQCVSEGLSGQCQEIYAAACRANTFQSCSTLFTFYDKSGFPLPIPFQEASTQATCALYELYDCLELRGITPEAEGCNWNEENCAFCLCSGYTSTICSAFEPVCGGDDSSDLELCAVTMRSTCAMEDCCHIGAGPVTACIVDDNAVCKEHVCVNTDAPTFVPTTEPTEGPTTVALPDSVANGSPTADTTVATTGRPTMTDDTSAASSTASVGHALLIVLLLIQLHQVAAIISAVTEEEEDAPSCHKDNGNKEECNAPPTRQQTCSLYLAESTIPNSGLGVFVGVHRPSPGSVVGPPEIAHQFILGFDDHPSKKKLSISSEWTSCMPHSYPWTDYVTGAISEASRTESFIPGIGMAANSLVGYQNVKSFMGNKTSATKGAGAGASSQYHSLRYTTHFELEVGSEIFADYGVSYFTGREEKFGKVPFKADFVWADAAVKKLWHARGGDTISEEVWGVIRNEFVSDERRRRALPLSASDLPRAAQIGAVRNFLGGNEPRSLDWLEANGYCMDTLEARPSDIPYAGRGAFAKQSFSAGEIVLPFPLLQINRDYLTIYEEAGEDQRKIFGYQLLLNYCLGHEHSSLLLLPYSSASHYINHGGSNSNAKLEWPSSDFPDRTNIFHQGEWLQMSAKDVLGQDGTGLMLHLVATRPIAEGEELTIDYGKAWTKAWATHLAEWSPPKGIHEYVSSAELNEAGAVLKTVFEQASDPYPPNISTACHYEFINTEDKKRVEDGVGSRIVVHVDEDAQAEKVDGNAALYPGFKSKAYLSNLEDELPIIEAQAAMWKHRSRETFAGDRLRPCKIIARHKNMEGRQDEEHYLVQMYNRQGHTEADKIPTDRVDHFVSWVPRRAILFIDRPYTGEQHLEKAFRHEIGIPEFPNFWRDLVDTSTSGAST